MSTVTGTFRHPINHSPLPLAKVAQRSGTAKTETCPSCPLGFLAPEDSSGAAHLAVVAGPCQ